MKKKVNYIQLMAWFIVIIMVLSVLGYVGSSFFSEQANQEEYNGFHFVKTSNQQWLLRVNGEEYLFQYLPEELKNVTFSTNLNFNPVKIYFGFQANDTINVGFSFSLLAKVFRNKGIKVQEACISEESCPDIPLMDCQNKEGIIMVSGEENGYTEDEKCLIITATDSEELQKLTERVVYHLLGVM